MIICWYHRLIIATFDCYKKIFYENLSATRMVFVTFSATIRNTDIIKSFLYIYRDEYNNRHISPVRTSSYRDRGYNGSTSGGGVRGPASASERRRWRSRLASPVVRFEAAAGGRPRATFNMAAVAGDQLRRAAHSSAARSAARQYTPPPARAPFARGAPPRPMRTAPPTDRAIRSRTAGPRACARLIDERTLA